MLPTSAVPGFCLLPITVITGDDKENEGSPALITCHNFFRNTVSCLIFFIFVSQLKIFQYFAILSYIHSIIIESHYQKSFAYMYKTALIFIVLMLLVGR